MGSKKHKKESKKKKHRSRSRSPLDGEERERKRHKKHKDRKKDRSPDVEEVPVDSHLRAPPARSRSASRDNERRARDVRPTDDREKSYEHERSPEQRPSPARVRSPSPGGGGGGGGGVGSGGGGGVGSGGGGGQESLSVDDTNRLRAKLGLKPLQTAEQPADDGKIKDDLGEFYHKPALNITQQKKSEKIREKLEERKEKRKLEQKLKTTLLAEGSDDEDAIAWVKKSREIEKQKRDAARRAAALDELDAEFGVGALLADDEREARAQRYTAGHLRGLRVGHDLAALEDERDVVLTLADKEILAEDAEDVLVNVNIVDDERYKKNIEERKKAASGYKAYDDEADFEAAALGHRKPVLAKYDDEILKERAGRDKGFLIGDDDHIQAARFREIMRQERMRGAGGAGGVERRLESLATPALQLASDYYDHDEVAKFKKPRKKGKMRRKPKEEPIDVDDYDAGAAPLDTDDTDVKPSQLRSLPLSDDEAEPDRELQAALARARRLRLRHAADAPPPKVEEVLERVKEECVPEEEGGMLLDATAEFCRTLGQAPARLHHDHKEEVDDLEMEVEPAGGAWSRVDVGSDQPPDIAAGPSAGLEAEPALGAGVAGALRLALSKGYLERAGPPPRAPHAHALAAAHYSIEDKAHGEDDKYGRRGGGGGGGHGPLSEFREKAGFRPSVKLEYVDDDGRALCPKEAFRYLSHKFHGKGPGKNKQEKRIKKAVQEGLMKKMSSTDTPLNTLQMLQDKQRETRSAYIVLQGAKRDNNN